MTGLLVFLGGGLGAVARYVVGLVASRYMIYPIGTLIVNIVGSLLIGILIGRVTEEGRLFLVVGLLGGFTTFSTFSMETVTLIQNGQMNIALMNVAINVVLGLVVAYVGSRI